MPKKTDESTPIGRHRAEPSSQEFQEILDDIDAENRKKDRQRRRNERAKDTGERWCP